MVGKQCFNNIVEILSPKLWNWWRKRTHVAATKDHDRRYTCWEKDYQLQDPGRLALFDEYLEMSESRTTRFTEEPLFTDIFLAFCDVYSSAVWVCNIIRSSVPVSTSVCFIE